MKTLDSFYVLTDLTNRSFECEDGSGGDVLEAKRFTSYGQASKFADDNKVRSRQYPVEISIVIN
jgi:hypothetical protein